MERGFPVVMYFYFILLPFLFGNKTSIKSEEWLEGKLLSEDLRCPKVLWTRLQVSSEWLKKKTFVSQNNMSSFYKCHIDQKLFSNLGEKR